MLKTQLDALGDITSSHEFKEMRAQHSARVWVFLRASSRVSTALPIANRIACVICFTAWSSSPLRFPQGLPQILPCQPLRRASRVPNHEHDRQFAA